MLELFVVFMFIYTVVTLALLVTILLKASSPFKPGTPKETRKYLMLCLIWPLVVWKDMYETSKETFLWLFSDLMGSTEDEETKK